MKLKSIEIQGFRGISSMTIEDFKQVNLFVGDNNSGKTSILEAIFLSVGISNPNLNMTINHFRDLLHVEADDFRFIFYKLDYKNKLSIKSEFDMDNYKRALIIQPNYEIPEVGKEIRRSEENGKSTISNESNVDVRVANGLLINFSIKERHKPKKEFTSSISLVNNRIETRSAKNYKEKLSAVFMTPSANIQIDKRLEKILVVKQEGSIIEILQKIDNTINGISLGTGGIIYFDLPGVERLVPLNLMGDGIRRILGILVNMHEYKNGMVIIDEIENGLYYSSTLQLWKALLTVAKINNVQIFITTHNIETLRYLKEVLELKEYSDFQDDVRSYTIRKMPQTIKVYKYDFKKFQHSIDQEIEVR